MMYRCRGKIIVTGVGKSGNIGAKIAATLSSTGTPAFFINPLDAYHGDLGVMTPDDIVLAISNSGQTDELLRFVPILLHMHVPIIGMSRNPESLLAKYSAIHIKVFVDHEACPLNLAPTSSTTAALAMGDALAIALMQVRDFRPRDFAQFHPGGELGKRLLTKAEDVMRTEDLPIIPEDMNLGKAIIDVSKGLLGMGVSLDSDNRVIGLITDGDIRRAMEKWQARFFDHTVSEIMTRTPKIVSPSPVQDPFGARLRQREASPGHRRLLRRLTAQPVKAAEAYTRNEPGSTRVGDHNNSFSINYLYHFERIFL